MREAELEPDDVVLEVGGGQGVLTERLAEMASAVHVIEIDERLREGLEAIAARLEGVRLVMGDAMKVDFRALDPAPTAMVANLPYSVATPVIMRSIEELPEVRRWTVMVQREIADRLRAVPRTKAYGAPSVLAQLSCRVEMLRAVDRAVFRPPPRVDSALLRLERVAQWPGAAVARLVRGGVRAQAQGARALGGDGGRGVARARARRRWRRSGKAADRAGGGARAAGVRGAREGAGGRRWSCERRRSSTCAFIWGRSRDDGLHELRSLFCPLALSDRITVTTSDDDARRGGLRGGGGAESGRRRRCAALRARGWKSPPLRIEIDKRIPVAAGLGGGSADAAAVLRLAEGEVDGLAGAGARAWARTFRRSSIRRSRWSAARASGSSDCARPASFGVVLVPFEPGLSAGEVYAEADRLGLGRAARGAGGDRGEACARRRRAAARRSPTRSCS